MEEEIDSSSGNHLSDSEEEGKVKDEDDENIDEDQLSDISLEDVSDLSDNEDVDNDAVECYA